MLIQCVKKDKVKPIIKKSAAASANSFIIKEQFEPYFDPNWHFHPEYQLFLVLESTGTRFIGDNIKPFGAGDLVFLGPNLPHLWHSDDAYFQGNHKLTVQGIVIYFTEDFLGRDFLHRQEMVQLRHLLEISHRGLEIQGNTRNIIAHMMRELLDLQGLDSILHLLSILNILAHSCEVSFISSLGFVNSYKQAEAERMNKVHEYVMTNFRTGIRLEEAASLANMSPTAFCRYFKTRTSKTFSDFISEIRIGYACKLLIEERLSVTQICYECGFKTLSNFNHQFKKITKESPLKYQHHYLKGV